MINHDHDPIEGILLVNKPKGKNSFSMVSVLRRIFNVKKIGHAGTLDPFATGVMVMLIGRSYTKLSDQFLCEDKEYVAEVRLGINTDTYDCDGQILAESSLVPSMDEITKGVQQFQGEIEQIPPMFSAKKVGGKKLYELARKGLEVVRRPEKVKVQTEILDYTYPYLNLKIQCSKGTYIRSIANDLGKILGCGAHLTNLQRTRSGPFCLADCFNGEDLIPQSIDIHALKMVLKTV